MRAKHITYCYLADLLTNDGIYGLSIDRHILVDLGPTGKTSVLHFAEGVVV